mgnify:FL=1|tara:strand:+ start:257 stop:733 length:477 start_codon:yes stop_codon:yes gene_type:complete
MTKTLSIKDKSNKDMMLSLLQEGETLLKISKRKDMASLSTIHRWIRDDNDLSEQVALARSQGALYWVEMAIDLTTQDLKPQDVMWAREKISTWKWLATKLLPQFSEKSHISTHNKHEVVTISWSGSISKCPKCGWVNSKEVEPKVGGLPETDTDKTEH